MKLKKLIDDAKTLTSDSKEEILKEEITVISSGQDKSHLSVKNQGDIKKVNSKGDAVEDTKGDRDKHVTSVVQKKWKSISAGRAEECLREAMRRGVNPLNTSRLI